MLKTRQKSWFSEFENWRESKNVIKYSMYETKCSLSVVVNSKPLKIYFIVKYQDKR